MSTQDANPAAAAPMQGGVVRGGYSENRTVRNVPFDATGALPGHSTVVVIQVDTSQARSAFNDCIDVLSSAPYEVVVCRSIAEVGRRIDGLDAVGMVIPVVGNSLEPLQAVIESLAMLAPGVRRVVTGDPALHSDPFVADALLRGLIYDVVALPQEQASLFETLKRSQRLSSIETTAYARSGDVVHVESQMVGTSPTMRRVFETIRKVARTEAAVLITGESGTGKELAARAIHERSTVANGPFVAINCAGIPSTLIESELFGYEKGAFTGASQRKVGRVETAHGGTLFLDEIGDMSLEVQAHLLRFLQEGKIQRLGGTKEIPVKTRILVATHVDLESAVARGTFREDLFYRLRVLTLEVPPLRERGDDIELLANYFLSQFAKEAGRSGLKLSKAALVAVRRHGWPGNVRELIGAMRRAAVMCAGQLVRPEDLGLSRALGQPADALPTLAEARARAEEELLRRALNHHANNVQQTAKALGVSRVALYRLLKKYDLGATLP